MKRGGTYQIRKAKTKRGPVGRLGAASKVRRIDLASPEGRAIAARVQADEPAPEWLDDWQQASEPA